MISSCYHDGIDLNTLQGKPSRITHAARFSPMVFASRGAYSETRVLLDIKCWTRNIYAACWRSEQLMQNVVGRAKCFDMFFAFNHPIYVEVEYSVLRNNVLYLEAIKNIGDRNITFNSKELTLISVHQGGDFNLEERIIHETNVAQGCYE